MKTIQSHRNYVPDFDLNLKNPLSQCELGWATFESEYINAAIKSLGLRKVDPGNVFSSTEQILGKSPKHCVLGNNVIGVSGWNNVAFVDQYHAVHNGAAAFIASAMQYVTVRGVNAGAVLDKISPRKMSNLAADSARFTLFTSPSGGVDEEAVVIRTKEDEYMMSCGGSRVPSHLRTVAEKYKDVSIEEGDTFSFNIKGPKRLDAVLGLVQNKDRDNVSRLKSFRSCVVTPVVGGSARIIKTIIGYEIWAKADTLSSIWLDLIQNHQNIIPCAWDLLNTYRVECRDIVFALYPLDIHSGTTLFEVNCGWMFDKNDERDFIGKASLLQLDGVKRFWYGGLISSDECDVPDIGSPIFSLEGKFLGYITTAAFSPKYSKVLLFAHLLPEVVAGNRVVVDNNKYLVSNLPFSSGIGKNA